MTNPKDEDLMTAEMWKEMREKIKKKPALKLDQIKDELKTYQDMGGDLIGEWDNKIEVIE